MRTAVIIGIIAVLMFGGVALLVAANTGFIGKSTDSEGKPYHEVVCTGKVKYAVLTLGENVYFDDTACKKMDVCKRTNLLAWYDNDKGVVSMHDSDGPIPGGDARSEELGIGIVDDEDGFQLSGCTADSKVTLKFISTQETDPFTVSEEVTVR